MFRALNNLVLTFMLMIVPLASFAEPFDHDIWNRLLAKHVSPINQGKSTVVDYSGFQQDQKALSTYLNSLSSLTNTQFKNLTNEQQLAFLINAYNAWTVELILSKYPDLESIKDLGGFFSSPWKKEFISLLGEMRSLDDIEHNLIRGSERYRDARIHFAVNCASIGCPALRAQAYVGEKLDAQLEEQTKLFLADETRNRFSDNELQVSSIFKWYREDFEKGWSGFDSLEGFFNQYADVLGLSQNQRSQLTAGDLDIDFLEYDWRLNKQ